MQAFRKRLSRHLARAGRLAPFYLTGLMSAHFAEAAPVADDYTAVPPLVELNNGSTMVMLTMSLDHQLFFKAYNDYDDLTGDNGDAPDGKPDTSYRPTFDYVGYFDHEKCYEYDGTKFVPSSSVIPADPEKQACPGPVWSGNFLNWLTMTRIDLVRMVLYGGYRAVDTPSATILERAFLPHDAHSFAKHYNGEELGNLVDLSALPTECTATDGASCGGYTFCSTSQPFTDWAGSGNVFSHSLATTPPPLLRVAKGNYSLWASSERFQCLYGPTARTNNIPEWNEIPHIGEPQRPDPVQREAEWPGHNGNNPTVTKIDAFKVPPNSGADFIVRVSVCGEGEAEGAKPCRLYPNGKRKPYGILQSYGEGKGVQFGLMTGGYESNLNWGVLRKNVGSITAEIDSETGVFSREGQTLIGNLDAMRIVDYQYFSPGGGEYEYVRRGTYVDTCFWGRNSIQAAGPCRNWGNPFSELLAESYRYFAGAEGPKDTSGDGGYLSNFGLGVDSWSDPLASDGGAACANLNVIGFNSSSVSYDTDLATMSLASDLGLAKTGTATTVAGLMTDINSVELKSPTYFVGKSSVNPNGLCTPKQIADLSLASGVCPEAPNQEGSFLGAGLAHYVYTNDIRPETPVLDTIRTFGVTLAGNVPKISVKVGVQDVEIVPACRNQDTGTNCAIVDFRPLEHADPPAIEGRKIDESGAYLVNWEDSEQGGDFDTDMNGIIRFAVADSKLYVETEALYSSTTNKMGFGFIVSGTRDDGMKILSGINNFNDFGDCQASGGCNLSDGKRRKVFELPADNGNAPTKAADFLESTLYYATKWGSFEELDDPENPMPNLEEEWNPANYALVTNPSLLQSQLEKVLDNASTLDTTGSAGVAFSQNSLTGAGLVAQSLYYPKLGTTTWAGLVHGLFLDQYGHLREDTNENLSLDAADLMVVPRQNTKTRLIEFVKYQLDEEGEPIADTDPPVVEPYALKTVFNAHKQLADVADPTKQRDYDSVANQRYVFSALDGLAATAPADGQITAGEVVPFAAAQAEQLAGLLDLPAGTTAESVINYIRGAETEGFRSRTTQWGNEELVWRLGDIAHSTPVIVGRPSERFDRHSNDPTYAAFVDKYRDRRQVAYVGANDGMLHAFNVGFYNTTKGAYQDTATGKGRGRPLGSELWAYVPYNLLPHLKWLTQPTYSHVYYVDSQVQTFDVNIFNADEDHPEGWGTILVVGMRFGGGPYDIAEGKTLRSGYAILDVTNPEKPPKLIAEVTHPELGYTTSVPDVFKFRRFDAKGEVSNKWYLAFGSGPQGTRALADGVSNATAKLFYLDLNQAAKGTIALQVKDTAAANSFVGGITAVDWDFDMTDDALVFGTVGDGTEANKGGLWYAELAASTLPGSVVADIDLLLDGTGSSLPFMAPPMALPDSEGNHWVFAGSGRFLSASDLTSAMQENAYFGIKVPAADARPVSISALTDVSGHRVYRAADRVFYATSEANPQPRPLAVVQEEIDATQGWYRSFPQGQANVTEALIVSSTIYTNAFAENSTSCESGATTTSYVMDMFTGLAQTQRVQLFIDSDAPAMDVDNNGSSDEAIGTVGDTMPGISMNQFASESAVVSAGSGGDIDPTNPNMIPPEPASRSWREVLLDEVVN